jgi:hypothetical protein
MKEWSTLLITREKQIKPQDTTSVRLIAIKKKDQKIVEKYMEKGIFFFVGLGFEFMVSH